MGYYTSRSFTEEGVKRLYQYFLINILFIFATLILTLLPLAMASVNIDFSSYFDYLVFGFAVNAAIMTLFFIVAVIAIWISLSGNLKLMLFATVLCCYALGFVIGILFFVVIIIIFLILLFLLLWSISNLFIGRKEFGKKHKLFVIVGFGLAVAYFVLFIANLILSSIFSNFSISLYLFTDFSVVQFGLLIMFIISIVLAVLSNLAFVLFIYDIYKRKVLLWIAFIMGLLSPFTFSLTGIISLILFFVCYRSATGDLEIEKTKPVLRVPCPFCNREISPESTSCPYCNTMFQKRDMETPKDDVFF